MYGGGLPGPDARKILREPSGTVCRRGPPEVGRAVKCGLRIAQGGLANVREHSGATTAALTLTSLDDQVVLDIADDGRGFDPERPGARSSAHGQGRRGEDPHGQDRRGEDLRGHGLPPIRARARQLGGTLTVESAPGRGTELSVSVPLTTPAPTAPPESP